MALDLFKVASIQAFEEVHFGKMHHVDADAVRIVEQLICAPVVETQAKDIYAEFHAIPPSTLEAPVFINRFLESATRTREDVIHAHHVTGESGFVDGVAKRQ